MIGRTREERKQAAFRRAQLSLKQAVERIDYDFDVIRPELEAMRQAAVTANVEADAPELEAPREDQ